MMGQAMAKEREFGFTDSNFACIRELVFRQTGISLSEQKKDMVYSRLSRRVRQLQLSGFDEYCRLLEEDPDAELLNLTNAITTNLTSFFRENHHFEFLKEELLPELVKKNQASRRLRIWSAGCSTGEEPYSIAIVIREALSTLRNWDIKILATDLDTNVLNTARTGIYDEARVAGIPEARKQRWFKRKSDNLGSVVRVKPQLQELITFKQLNLMHQWPMQGPFDLIFCRNVVIYFDKPTQKILIDRYADILRPDGHLFMGHSETLYKVSDRFDLLGKTIYQRIK